MLLSLIASIPSPPSNAIDIGPIPLRAYGLLIGLGVLAGVWLASKRVAKDGLDPDIIPSLTLWVLPAAIVGARIYFVTTNWGRFSEDIGSAFRLWEGGLGIPGGVALGGLVGVWWLRRNEIPLPPVFTAVALGLPLGQIIGRFGNWFNQELYGRPTELPWGLEIDSLHRLPGYEDPSLLFHPTFAYEILWNIGLLGFLLWLDRRDALRPGALFAVYLIGYGIGRTWIELFRIDPVNELFGVRLHIWAMIVFMIGAAYWLLRHGIIEDDFAAAAEGDAEAADLDQDPAAKTARALAGARKTPAQVKRDAARARAKAKRAAKADDQRRSSRSGTGRDDEPVADDAAIDAAAGPGNGTDDDVDLRSDDGNEADGTDDEASTEDGDRAADDDAPTVKADQG